MLTDAFKAIVNKLFLKNFDTTLIRNIKNCKKIAYHFPIKYF